MNQDLTKGLAWAGGLLALALAATLARRLGYIDGDAVTRVVMGATGLVLVWYGNRMPKAFVPGGCARQVQRVGGWSMVLSGLAYAGLWAFAPLSVAFMAGCGAVIAGLAVTIGYGLALRSRKAA